MTMTRHRIIAVLLALGLAACGSTAPSPSATTDESSPTSSSAASSATPPSATPSGEANPTPGGTSAGASAGPSAGPSGIPDVTAIEACGLLTGAEIAKILGVAAVQPRPMPSSGWMVGQCAWNGPATGFFISLGTAASIEAFGDVTAPDAAAKLAQFKAQTGGKDEPGIGEGAALATTGLAAYKGGTYIQITSLGLTKRQLLKIATKALSRV